MLKPYNYRKVRFILKLLKKEMWRGAVRTVAYLLKTGTEPKNYKYFISNMVL